jgi:hypothetical protein
MMSDNFQNLDDRLYPTDLCNAMEMLLEKSPRY